MGVAPPRRWVRSGVELVELSERYSRRTFLGSVLVLVGSVPVALVSLLREPERATWGMLGVLASLLAVALLLLRRPEGAYRRIRRPS